MIYLWIAVGVFLLDLGIKHYMDRKYARKVRYPRFKNKIILEKYYNNGAALNFMAGKPALMKALHTVIVLTVAIFYYFLLKEPGKALEKTGVALLVGGGAGNLYDRYTKGHVVDYFRINMGPKRLGRIIFNISDFCIFIGALLAVIGAEESR